jgi:hypothetical protein
MALLATQRLGFGLSFDGHSGNISCTTGNFHDLFPVLSGNFSRMTGKKRQFFYLARHSGIDCLAAHWTILSLAPLLDAVLTEGVATVGDRRVYELPQADRALKVLQQLTTIKKKKKLE